jgi:cell pole-organizing protein PopZ
MEEILASIRRIISEDTDEAADRAKSADAGKSSSPDAGDNVLELTEVVGEDGEVVSLKDEPAAKPAPAAAKPSDPEPPLRRRTVEATPPPSPPPAARPSAEAKHEFKPDFKPEPKPAEKPKPAVKASEVAFAAEEDTVSNDALMSDEKAFATAAAMSGLLDAVKPPPMPAPVASSGGRTVEDIARELLRPMLKEWLDQNLPPLVERIVRSEIQRVVGRVRGQ